MKEWFPDYITINLESHHFVDEIRYISKYISKYIVFLIETKFDSSINNINFHNVLNMHKHSFAS